MNMTTIEWHEKYLTFKPINIIIEGPDRTGKDTLISKLANHFEQPCMILHSIALNDKERAQHYYRALFKKILDNRHDILLLNRAHLGEVVYSPRFRDYNGDYVFEFEKPITDIVLLLLLYSSDVKCLHEREDGESLIDGDFYQSKQRENDDFVSAYQKSNIKFKHMIDVADKTPDDVFEDALKSIQDYIDISKYMR